MDAGQRVGDPSKLSSRYHALARYTDTERWHATMTAQRPRPVSIGEVIKHAVAFNPRRWRGAPVNAGSLPQTVADLLRLLREREIDYVMVGGLALLHYVTGRNTEDIDVIMASASLRRALEIEVIEQNADFAWGQFRDLRIDVLLTRNCLFETVRTRYSAAQEFQEQAIPCATVEGLVLLKLYALPSLYRQGDFSRVNLYEGDIASLLQAYRPALGPILDELAPHISETDLAAVRSILADIQQRIARFEQGRSPSTD